MKPHAAIIGTGESPIGRVPGRDSTSLMAEAAANAVADAGLEWDAIDGLITLPNSVDSWMMPAAILARILGVNATFLTTIDLAGAGGTAMVDQAARAVATGACEAVLCVAGQSLLSGTSRDAAVASMARNAGHAEAEAPTGIPIPGMYALLAARHMHEYGTTREQLAAVAVQMRAHAALNPNAHFRKPITVADVLASKPIADPLCLLDCAPVSDGAAAFVVTTASRARAMKPNAAYLLGSGYGLSHGFLTDADDPLRTGAVQAGRIAFEKAGLTPADMQFACIYDCFTITLLLELEQLGFCATGESGAMVESGALARDGALPVNTFGGLLSGGHPRLPAGLFPVVEAARQVMGRAGERQLPRHDLAMAHGAGGIVGMHCSLILGSNDV